jgi:uncharacterized protein YecE (DUF72 family)
MQFGRVTDLAEVNFELPPAHPATANVLGGTPAASPNIFIGCSVWSDRKYKGRVYPLKTPQKEFLNAYGEAFSTVELNSTHYSIPHSEQIIKWRDAVPPGFHFMPKVPQYISHRRDPLQQAAALDIFIIRMAELEDRLGPILLQIPHHFGAEHISVLEQFFQVWPVDMRLVLEVRHEDLLKSGPAQDELFGLMEKYNIGSAISDVAGRRDALHMRLSTPDLLLRFNGHNLHPTDFARMDAWAEQLVNWLHSGLQSAHVYMHQPEQELNADAAIYLIKKLNSMTGLKLKEPIWYVQPELFG